MINRMPAQNGPTPSGYADMLTDAPQNAADAKVSKTATAVTAQPGYADALTDAPPNAADAKVSKTAADAPQNAADAKVSKTATATTAAAPSKLNSDTKDNKADKAVTNRLQDIAAPTASPMSKGGGQLSSGSETPQSFTIHGSVRVVDEQATLVGCTATLDA